MSDENTKEETRKVDDENVEKQEAIREFLGIESREDIQEIKPKIFEAIYKQIVISNDIKTLKLVLETLHKEFVENNERVLEECERRVAIAEEKVSVYKKKNKEQKEKNNNMQESIDELQKKCKQMENQIQLHERNLKEEGERQKTVDRNNTQNSIVLHQKNDELTHLSLQQAKKTLDLTRHLEELKGELFETKLELNRKLNGGDALQSQISWYEGELKLMQTRYMELLKKNETDCLRSRTEIDQLTMRCEYFENQKKEQTNIIEKLKQELEEQIELVTSKNVDLELAKSKFTFEHQSQNELIELKTLQSQQRLGRVEQLEKHVEDLKNKYFDSLKNFEALIAKKNQEINDLNEKMKLFSDFSENETVLSVVDVAKEEVCTNNTSNSLLYKKISDLKKKLLDMHIENTSMNKELEITFKMIESKNPIISNYRDQIEFYESSLNDSMSRFENLKLEKNHLENTNHSLQLKINESENEIILLKKVLKDVGKQLCYFLIYSNIKENNSDPLTESEKKTIEFIYQKTKSDIKETECDKLISERLLTFKNIIELKNKNELFLTIVRNLTIKLEEKELQSKKNESKALKEAQESIFTLKNENENLSFRLETLSKEKDVFKLLFENNKNSNDSELLKLKNSNDDLKNEIEEFKTVMKKLKEETIFHSKNYEKKISDFKNNINDLILQLNDQKKKSEMSELNLRNLSMELSSCKKELVLLEDSVNFWKTQFSKQEKLLLERTENLSDAKSNLSEKMIEITKIETQMSFCNLINKNQEEEIHQLKIDKDLLNKIVIDLQNTLKERKILYDDFSENLKKSGIEVQNLRDEINQKNEKIYILTNQIEVTTQICSAKSNQLNECLVKLLESNKVNTKNQNIIDTLKSRSDENKNSELLKPNQFFLDSKNDIQTLKNELIQKNLDLQKSEDQLTEIIKLLKSNDFSLKTSNESFKRFKKEFEQQIVDLNNDNHKLIKSLDDVKLELDSTLKELNNFKNLNNELNLTIHDYKEKINNFQVLEKNLNEKITFLSNNSDLQINLYKESQEKYHNELKKNTKLTETNFSLKKELDEKNKIVGLYNNDKKLQQVILDFKNELEIGSSASEKEFKLLETKYKDLQNQNKLILNQLELSKESKSDIETKDNFNEIISYLRREKEFFELKFTESSHQNKQLQVQIQKLLQQISIIKIEHLTNQNKNISISEIDKEKQDLELKIEQMTILRENNTMLMSQIEFKTQKIEQLENELNRSKDLENINHSELKKLITENDVLSQEVKLLTEENDILRSNFSTKSDLSKDDTQNMKDKYNELRKKANSRIQSQNDKIKELLDLIASLKKEKEVLKTSNTNNSSSDNRNNQKKKVNNNFLKKISTLNEEKEILKTKLTDAESKLSAIDLSKKELEMNFQNLQENFNNEKLEMQKLLDFHSKKIEDQVAIIENLNKSQDLKPEIDNLQNLEDKVEAMKTELQQSYEAKFKELNDSFDQKKKLIEDDYKSKIDKQVLQTLETEKSKLLEEHKKNFNVLKNEFNENLTREKKIIRSQVEKLFEMKIKMLTKKVEKLESNSEKIPKKPIMSLVENTENKKKHTKVNGNFENKSENLLDNKTVNVFENKSITKNVIPLNTEQNIKNDLSPTQISVVSTQNDFITTSNSHPRKPTQVAHPSFQRTLGNPYTESTLTVHQPNLSKSENQKKNLQFQKHYQTSNFVPVSNLNVINQIPEKKRSNSFFSFPNSTLNKKPKD